MVQRAIQEGIERGYNQLMSEILKRVIQEGIHISESSPTVLIKDEGEEQ